MKSSRIAGSSLFQITAVGTNRCTSFQTIYRDSGTYSNEKWWKLMQHTIKEATRLAIKIGMHSCPGWSMSGVPWITPKKQV